MDIRGSVAIVTGASRGIGEAAAIALGRNGAKVVVNSRGSPKAAQDVAERIRKAGSEAIVAMGDVADYEACGRIVRAATDAFGAVDVLVNNAGVFSFRRLLEMAPRDWEAMFEVHVFGAFNMIRHALPHMVRRKRGVIVNVTSFVAVRPPGPGRAHYAAAKAALMGLTKALALEVAPSGVRVVGLAPGLTRTEMVVRGLSDLDARVKTVPLGRMAEPEEIAHAVVFLVENDFATSDTLYVAGGE